MRWLLLFIAALSFTGCFGPPRSVSEPDGVRILRDWTYATVDGENLQLDLYLPDRFDKPLPIVVWIHGGGWVSGERSPCPVAMLATRGYAVASISYRLARGDATFPAPLYDCKAAIRWLRVNAWRFGCDPDHIGVWGASAGGHLAALLGTTADDPALEGSEGVTGVSSRVQAVCALFPATDFVHLEEVEDHHWRINLVAKALFHGPPSKHPELAASASPIIHVSKTSAPFLLIHGTADTMIPPAQSERMHAALKKVGADSSLLLIEGMPHGNRTLARTDLQQAVEAFFAKHLRPLRAVASQ
ncbi:MAG: alpha/beta hydrolase [Planctomycetes bacterium]|jgi:acetyl esterase/lipase|nr:alpha/beta hydrolase [Planctomycetota bacterium]